METWLDGGDTKFKHGVGSTTICLARDGGLTPNKECSNKFCLKKKCFN